MSRRKNHAPRPPINQRQKLLAMWRQREAEATYQDNLLAVQVDGRGIVVCKNTVSA